MTNTNLSYSRHAMEERMPQRGLSEDDVELIIQHGQSSGDGILLTSKEVNKAKQDIRKELTKKMNQLDRLSGSTVIMVGNKVITVLRKLEKRAKKARRLKHI